jgi:hypothetical protein
LQYLDGCNCDLNYIVRRRAGRAEAITGLLDCNIGVVIRMMSRILIRERSFLVCWRAMAVHVPLRTISPHGRFRQTRAAQDAVYLFARGGPLQQEVRDPADSAMAIAGPRPSRCYQSGCDKTQGEKSNQAYPSSYCLCQRGPRHSFRKYAASSSNALPLYPSMTRARGDAGIRLGRVALASRMPRAQAAAGRIARRWTGLGALVDDAPAALGKMNKPNGADRPTVRATGAN